MLSPQDQMEVLRTRLIAMRTEKGISQRELDRLAGVANSTTRRLEAGGRGSVDFATVVAIAAVLGTTADWLAGTAVEPLAPLAEGEEADLRVQVAALEKRCAELTSLLHECLAVYDAAARPFHAAFTKARRAISAQ